MIEGSLKGAALRRALQPINPHGNFPLNNEVVLAMLVGKALALIESGNDAQFACSAATFITGFDFAP